MQREVLAQQLRPDARILDLVGRHARPLVGGDVAHAIAAGLHSVQAGARQIRHRVGQLRELDPVELDVLPRGEMAVAAVVFARHVREHSHLVGGQRAVGNRDPQHIGVQLQIDPVHEAQRLELVFRQLAGQAAADLVAEFAHALFDERAVEVVVDVHLTLSLRPAARRSVRCSGCARADCPA